MKSVTRVRYAAHLMAYIEELYELQRFTKQELHVIHDALLLLIGQAQQDSANKEAMFPVKIVPPISTKIYEFKLGNYAPNRIFVYEDGQPERHLRHVPIFAYGFGLAGLPALDSALAILADFFGETLSMQAFATGQEQYCSLYQAFARDILTRPRFLGRFETKHLVTFLRHEDRKKQEKEKSDANQ